MSTETGNPADPTAGQVPAAEQTPAATPSPSNPQPETGAEPFDEARARATIAHLREREKALDKTAKDREREAQELRGKVDAFEAEKLSEQERQAKRLADAERKAADTETQLRETRLRYAVAVAAQAKGIVDPDAAVKLLDLSSVSYASDGTPQGVDTALDALTAAKPYLLKQAAAPAARAGSPANPATGRTEAGEPVFTTSQLQAGGYAFYQEHRAEIERALRAGRIRKE